MPANTNAAAAQNTKFPRHKSEQAAASAQNCQVQAEFLAKISHDIRTPLNAIMGYAEMLHKTNLDTRQQHFASNIIKSSLALVDILNTWLKQATEPHPGQESQLQTSTSGQAAPATEVHQESAPLKLMVVEDSSMIRDLFLDIFSEDNFTILTASSGAKALELAFSELPQLIFIDLNLPDTDGWQVAKTLRNNTQTTATPLIVMTGQFLKAEEYKHHFDDFLQKPFQLKQLRTMVDSWIHPPACAGTSAMLPVNATPTTGDENLAEIIRPYWSMQLAKLLAAATHSGSLQVARQLGDCLLSEGEQHNCPPMQRAGSRLVHCASEPDIAGMEALIAQLIPLLKES
ncbi:MAG: response regulator [Desulfobulbaceae bacterium]|nr:response regulator [Desulfobulbaceae bacterium]